MALTVNGRAVRTVRIGGVAMANWIADNRYLSQAEMEHNALIIRDHLRDMGWSDNAIAATLANMRWESNINPGIWESLVKYGGGFGLVQWTPYIKYSQWAGNDWESNYDKQLSRIDYERKHGIQWFANPEVTPVNPPVSFDQYAQSDLPPDTLARYWCWYYEHPAHPVRDGETRAPEALMWYEFLTNHPYVPGVNTDILLYWRRKHVKKSAQWY